MFRSRVAVLAAAVGTAALLVALAPARAQGNKWVTVKGQITFANPPKPAALDVTADKEHCLSNGPLVSDEIVVDAKTKGLKNVFVWVMPETKDGKGENTIARAWPKDAIHPELAKAKAKEQVIDQPCCMFVPRVLAARDGDTLLVKNSAPVSHNVNISTATWDMNAIIPAKGEVKGKGPLAAQWTLVPFKCDIHPWMKGTMMVFDHPYYALTAADGTFEIKGLPAAKLRIMYRHEQGNHKGIAGGRGFPLDTTAGTDVAVKPFDFEIVTKAAK